jgi:mandelamide amidase
MPAISLMTGADLVRRVLSGDISAQEVVSALLSASAATPSINAFISLDRDVIETQARILDSRFRAGERLQLHGLPVIVKDNIDSADFRTTCGTPSLRDNRPVHNAVALQALIDAGAIVFGKANLDELAGGVTSNNPYFGAVHNPYDQSMIAGGSSGGTAAAIAARQGPVGLATDTGGSARIPAALCGVCGFRPSTGRYSSEGVLILSPTRDTIGLMARTVADIELLDQAMTGCVRVATANIADVRFGVPRAPYFDDQEAGIASAMTEAIRNLAANGAQIVERDMDEIGALHDACSSGIVLAEVRDSLQRYLEARGIALDASDVIRGLATRDLRERLSVLIEAEVNLSRYRELLDVARPRLQRAFNDYFTTNRVELMVYPTTVLTARPIGADEYVDLNGHNIATFRAYSRNTDMGANAGLPSLTIPIALSETGLPIGLSVEGPRGSDARLLAIGRAIQNCLPLLPPPLALLS